MGSGKSIGIHVGALDVTTIELTMTKRGAKFELRQLVQQTIPQGTEVFGRSEPGRTAQVQLQQLKEAFKLEQGVSTFLSFSPESVVLRYFKMLKIPKREWEIAIRFEARKYLPFNMEQMNSDFIVLPPVKRSNDLEVIFFAVDQSYAQRWTRVVQEIWGNVAAIETSWLSVLRLLKWNQQLKGKEKEGGILLSLEPDRLGICLFLQGVPYFSREAKWISSIIDPSSADLIESVAGEIRLAKEFHRKNFPLKELSTIYCVGSWVNQSVVAELTKECEIATVMADPFLKLEGEKPAILSTGVVVSIGAALRNFMEESAEILIHLGESAGLEKKKISPNVLLAGETVAAILAIIGIQLYASSQVKQAQETYHSVVQKRPIVMILANPLAPVEELETIEEQHRQKIVFLKAIMQERVDVTSKMAALAGVFPDSIWLERFYWKETLPEDLSKQKREIRIKGAVYSEEQRDIEVINNFADQLKKSGFSIGVEDSEIISIERSQLGLNKVTQFEWRGSLTVKDKPGS